MSFDDTLTEPQALDLIESRLPQMEGHPALAQWDNLDAPPHQYRSYAVEAARVASPRDRSWADFAAAFACEAVLAVSSGKELRVQDTALRTMSGAGHQDFIASMRNIVRKATREHVRKALFALWAYDDPVQNHTLRWNPADDVRHALRWRDPSGDPARRTGGTVLGASRLGIEALALLPTAPVGSRLETTGFTGSGSRNTFWTWPIWDCPADVEISRSLLALDELMVDRPEPIHLRSRGIVAVYRSQRITEGKFRNFTPARVVA